MAKLKLVAAPTFKAKVPIPVAGGPSVEVEFTFKHRTKSALDEWLKSRTEKADADSFLEMVAGWELEDEFSKANVELLLENYVGAAVATVQTYLAELVKARVKN